MATDMLTAWARTYVGVQLMHGIGCLLLCNDAGGSTRCLVAYFDDDPVTITYEEE